MFTSESSEYDAIVDNTRTAQQISTPRNSSSNPSTERYMTCFPRVVFSTWNCFTFEIGESKDINSPAIASSSLSTSECNLLISFCLTGSLYFFESIRIFIRLPTGDCTNRCKSAAWATPAMSRTDEYKNSGNTKECMISNSRDSPDLPIAQLLFVFDAVSCWIFSSFAANCPSNRISFSNRRRLDSSVMDNRVAWTRPSATCCFNKEISSAFSLSKESPTNSLASPILLANSSSNPFSKEFIFLFFICNSSDREANCNRREAASPSLFSSNCLLDSAILLCISLSIVC